MIRMSDEFPVWNRPAECIGKQLNIGVEKMIELQTSSPTLTVRVFPQDEIEAVKTPRERCIVISITNTDRRNDLANLENLKAFPILRLDFFVDVRDKGMTETQAVRFWEFIKDNLTGLETILLHCSAGAMRSPALALAISHAFLGGEFPVEADIEPSLQTYLTAVAAYPSVFGRPFPEIRLDELEEG